MRTIESFHLNWLLIPCVWLLMGVCAFHSAHAQGMSSEAETARVLPAESYWGRARFESTDRVSIEGRIFKFGPAVYIRDERNMMLTPYALLSKSGDSWVRFKTDNYGHVVRLWLLTTKEIAGLQGR